MAKRKKKKAPRSLAPYQLKYDDRRILEHTVLKIADYRGYQYEPMMKIRTRLFYRGDDLPDKLWALPIPDDWDDLFSYNKQLITMVHTGRVGIAETSVLEHEADLSEDFNDSFSCIFEDYNDLLLFKLALI